MAQAYVPIQTVTVGSGGASSIEFTNIPQTYTDLFILASIRSNTGGDTYANVFLTMNGVGGTSYSGRGLRAIPNNVYSDTQSSAAYLQLLFSNGDISTSNTFGNMSIYIPNYTSSNNKSFSIDYVTENNATTSVLGITAGLFSSSAAITSIKLQPYTASFFQHSTATLYGIGGARASGGTITADARYTYHTFTSTGTFTALEKIKGAEVLCIAGGGGGGGQPDSGNAAGGGGAGGVLYTAGQSLSAGNSYTVVVGSGGAGGSAGANNGVNGSNSQFGSLTAIGGGFGVRGAGGGPTGGSGGSGGATSGSGTVGQGNDGGYIGSNYQGGGGGGAGAAGSTNGNGGVGTTTYSSWGYATSTGQSSGGMYYYAGGGGGGQYFYTDGSGLGGLGGGGNGGRWNGSTVTAAVAGTANTGGGGGAAGSRDGQGAKAGAAGGSGLVIIRYPN